MTSLLERLRELDPTLCGTDSLLGYVRDERHFGNEIVVLRHGRRMLLRLVQDRGFVELEWADCPDYQQYDVVSTSDIDWEPIASAPPAIPPVLIHKLQRLCGE